jgi:hypothetical protein
MTAHPPQLGAQDPERKNSPVAWEQDEEVDAVREMVPEEPTCFFNDRAYVHGTIIGSGSALLRCDNGVWVPTGPAVAGKP